VLPFHTFDMELYLHNHNLRMTLIRSYNSVCNIMVFNNLAIEENAKVFKIIKIVFYEIGS
jgi:hypothetical protein